MSRKEKFFRLIAAIFYLLAVFLMLFIFSLEWFFDTLSFEQICFHLKYAKEIMPLKGEYITVFSISVVLFFVGAIVLYWLMKKLGTYVSLCGSLILLLLVFFWGSLKYDFFAYIQNQFEYSDFYEKNYIQPSLKDFTIEVSSKNAKEDDAVKIPNHIRTMIPEFFGLDEAETQEINGTAYKVKHISLEVVNAKTDEKYKDDEAMITYKPRQSYLTFVSSVLSNIMYDEDDIVRIIKLSDNEYHMEIISKKMKEYKVWSKLCNQTFRTSTKKFGVM